VYVCAHICTFAHKHTKARECGVSRSQARGVIVRKQVPFLRTNVVRFLRK